MLLKIGHPRLHELQVLILLTHLLRLLQLELVIDVAGTWQLKLHSRPRLNPFFRLRFMRCGSV